MYKYQKSPLFKVLFWYFWNKSPLSITNVLGARKKSAKTRTQKKSLRQTEVECFGQVWDARKTPPTKFKSVATNLNEPASRPWCWQKSKEGEKATLLNSINAMLEDHKVRQSQHVMSFDVSNTIFDWYTLMIRDHSNVCWIIQMTAQ